MQAAETYALGQVEKMADWAVSGKVTIDLICSPIQEVVEEIAASHPWTMSWSNVVDYVGYDEYSHPGREGGVYHCPGSDDLGRGRVLRSD